MMTRLTIRHPMLVSVLALCCCTWDESPGDKQEWSILQSIELSTRDQRTSDVRFRTVDGYELVGVPRHGDGRIIWVMLKPAHGARYKQMPEGNFSISQDTYSSLSARHRVSSTVAAALRGHVVVSEPTPRSSGAAEQDVAAVEAPS